MEGFKQPEKKRTKGVVRAAAVAGMTAMAAFAPEASHPADSLELRPRIETTARMGIDDAVREVRLMSIALGADSAKFKNYLRDFVAEQPAVTAEAAILAYNREPDKLSLEKDPAFRNVGAIPRELLKPLVFHTTVQPDYFDQLKRVFSYRQVPDGLVGSDAERVQQKIIDDAPHLARIMKAVSDRYGHVDSVELEQAAFMVARNLHQKFGMITPTNEMVRNEVRAISQVREKMGDEQLFGQKFVIVSHGEIYKQLILPRKKNEDVHWEDRPGFVSGELMHAVESVQQKVLGHTDVMHIAAFKEGSDKLHTSQQLAQDAKQDALEFLRTRTEPMTVLFTGHGAGDGFFLWQGQITNGAITRQGSVSISVAELVETLAHRWKMQHKAYPADTELNVTLLFDACYMHNYLRAVAEGLAARHVPLPHLMISSAEYGQVGFYRRGKGSVFKDALIAHSVLNDFMRNKTEEFAPTPPVANSVEGRISAQVKPTLKEPSVSTPSIFVPRPDNKSKLMQIGGNYEVAWPVLPA